MKNCIFCKIIKGEAESKKVYEDDLVMAFLPKEPVTEQHILLVPKKHYENIFDIPYNYLKRIAKVLKVLSERIKKETGAKGINILHASGKDAQQSVFHFHFHLVPRFPNDKLDLWIEKNC